MVKDSVDSLINYSQTPQGKNEHEADSFINYMDGEESKIKYDDEQSPTPMVIILPMHNIVLIASAMKKITHLVG